MDYKKKYEQALERCKKEFNFNNLAYSHEEIKQKLERVFPELNDDERIKKEIIEYLEQSQFGEEHYQVDDDIVRGYISWLEKQSKQEQLYIRFGKIPTDEKSKIYQGEIEVGTENGVSVYPAFKTDKGDIVLGLSLPITKTTLYTQQHLIEYDDRPCYLVKGDYVGKDTDGQPLINNISIIEKIDDYRVKEEKQNKQKPADKVEPKFKVGDWIVTPNNETKQIEKVTFGNYYFTDKTIYNVIDTDNNGHFWTIEDAKDGDVLCYRNDVFLVKHYVLFNKVVSHCTYGEKFIPHNTYSFTRADFSKIYPATKEQRDLLFRKMKEAGYEWDSEKKELKMIEQKPAFCHHEVDLSGCSEEYRKAYYDGWNNCNQQHSQLKVEQKPVWSKEDENMLQKAISTIMYALSIPIGKENDPCFVGSSTISWLKSLKERMKGE